MVHGYNSLPELQRSPALNGITFDLELPRRAQPDHISVDTGRVANIAAVTGVTSLRITDNYTAVYDALRSFGSIAYDDERDTLFSLTDSETYACLVIPSPEDDRLMPMNMGQSQVNIVVKSGQLIHRLASMEQEEHPAAYARELDIILRKSLRYGAFRMATKSFPDQTFRNMGRIARVYRDTTKNLVQATVSPR